MNRLREIREKADMNQFEVASAIGICRSTYANYESDRRQASHETLIKLAELFHVTVDYILCRDEAQPTVRDDELRARAIERVQSLPDPALTRVLDFLEGLEAGREIGVAEGAADGQAGQSSE